VQIEKRLWILCKICITYYRVGKLCGVTIFYFWLILIIMRMKYDGPAVVPYNQQDKNQLNPASRARRNVTQSYKCWDKQNHIYSSKTMGKKDFFISNKIDYCIILSLDGVLHVSNPHLSAF
jgi:hypothetical protein